jgi:hypothetical protein
MMRCVNQVSRKFEWDIIVKESEKSFFWHTSKWLEYTLSYIPDSISRSFYVEDDKGCIIAVCPLIQSGNEFVMYWSPVIKDRTDNMESYENIYKRIFEHIDMLAKQYDIVRSSMMIYPLSQPNFNYLTKYGYLDISLATQVIDLHDTDILGGMRRGHQSDIKKGMQSLTTEVIDMYSNNVILTFAEYHELHTIDAGRETRNQTTWDMQLQWLRTGDAILIGTKHNNKFVGFSYIFLHNKKAYYGSACSQPGIHLPIGHVLTWKTIQYLREQNFDYYEIGWQQFGNQIYDIPTSKEISISHFKRGFGGITLPLYRGEKYYDKCFLEKIQNERVVKYAKILG